MGLFDFLYKDKVEKVNNDLNLESANDTVDPDIIIVNHNDKGAVRRALDLTIEKSNESKEPERVSNVYENKPWYDQAEVLEGQKTRGEYPAGHPEGAIIHFTAGRRKYKGRQDYVTGKESMNNSIRNGKYAYFTIGMDGTIWQSAPLTHWGYHAGKSFHRKLNTSNVSRHCVGIEICNAGPLSESTSWFNKKFKPEEIRTLNPHDYDNCLDGGQFLKFSEDQEESLTDLLLWLNKNNAAFKFDNVMGHDEVSPCRKVDPGGSLSMPMHEYRKHLRELIK